jgi:hypothetical protein
VSVFLSNQIKDALVAGEIYERPFDTFLIELLLLLELQHKAIELLLQSFVTKVDT